MVANNDSMSKQIIKLRKRLAATENQNKISIAKESQKAAAGMELLRIQIDDLRNDNETKREKCRKISLIAKGKYNSWWMKIIINIVVVVVGNSSISFYFTNTSSKQDLG